MILLFISISKLKISVTLPAELDRYFFHFFILSAYLITDLKCVN